MNKERVICWYQITRERVNWKLVKGSAPVDEARPSAEGAATGVRDESRGYLRTPG